MKDESIAKKEKAIELLKEMDIYTPYIKGFEEKGLVCFKVVTDIAECFFKAEPRKQVLIEVVLREGIFFIPLVAEQFG